MNDVNIETLFSACFHSCKKQLTEKILKNNMSSLKYEDTYEIQRNFFEENTDMDINKLNDLVGNKHLYCYVPEKDAHESSRSNSDTNEDESSKEENISPNNAKINSAGHKDWYICGHCKKEIRNRLFMLSRSCSDFRRVL